MDNNKVKSNFFNIALDFINFFNKNNIKTLLKLKK